MTLPLFIVEQGSIHDPIPGYDTVIVKYGAPRPLVHGKLLFAEEGSVIEKPDWLTLVPVQPGRPIPVPVVVDA